MNGNSETHDIEPPQVAKPELSPAASSVVIEVLEEMLQGDPEDGVTTVFAEQDGSCMSAQWETLDHAARIIRIMKTSPEDPATKYFITCDDTAAELSCNANGTVTTPRGSLTHEDVVWLSRLRELYGLEKLEREYMLQVAEAVDGRALHRRKQEPLDRERLREMWGIGVASPMGMITTKQSRQVKNPLEYFKGRYRKDVDEAAKFPIYDKRGDLWGYEVWAWHRVVAEERRDEVQDIENVCARSLRQATCEVDMGRVDILREIAARRPELIIDSGLMQYNDIAQLRATENPRWDNTHVVIPIYGKEGFPDQSRSHVFSLPTVSVTKFEELLARQP